jgi:hypothetical protein
MSDYNPSPVPVTRTSITAIISLITGIAGVVQILPVIGPIAAIITGHIAKKEIKNSGGMVTGNGMATAGLIMGYVTLGLLACGCIVAIILFATGMLAIPWSSSYSY